MSKLALIFQLISTTIMSIGVVFGIQNIRQFFAGCRRESALLLLNSFQTGEFVTGLILILNSPAPMGKAEVDRLPPDEQRALLLVIGAWERLGVLVFRGEVDIELVDDAYSGPVVQSWQKLEPYIQDFRTQMQRDTAMEWFQWLAERLMERETAAQPVPAYLAPQLAAAPVTAAWQASTHG